MTKEDFKQLKQILLEVDKLNSKIEELDTKSSLMVSTAYEMKEELKLTVNQEKELDESGLGKYVRKYF